MTLKRYLFAGLSVSAILLTACDQESIEDVEASANELDELHTQVVNELNGLYETELELQDAFSETLASDGDLTTLTDGTSPVYANLEERSGRLDTIEELENQIVDQANILSEYEGERLPTSELESIAEEFTSFTGLLENYREQYSNAITSQEEYFNNIAAADATYELFAEGIQTINEQHQELQEPILELDTELVQFEDALTELQSLIEEANAEEE